MNDNYIPELKIPTTLCCNNSLELNLLYEKLCGNQAKTLTIFHLNIRGIQTNYNEFNILLNSLNFEYDIIILTETHIKHTTNAYNLPNYSTFYYNNNVKHMMV